MLLGQKQDGDRAWDGQVGLYGSLSGREGHLGLTPGALFSKGSGTVPVMTQKAQHSDTWCFAGVPSLGFVWTVGKNCGRGGGRGLTFLKGCWEPGPVLRGSAA